MKATRRTLGVGRPATYYLNCRNDGSLSMRDQPNHYYGFFVIIFIKHALLYQLLCVCIKDIKVNFIQLVPFVALFLLFFAIYLYLHSKNWVNLSQKEVANPQQNAKNICWKNAIL